MADRRFRIASTDPLHPHAEEILKAHHLYILPPDKGEDALRRIISDVDGLIVRTKLPHDIFDSAPRLLACMRHGVGLDFIPVEAATQNKIAVANLPDANSQAVVEHVVGVILLLARDLSGLNRRFRDLGWSSRVGHRGIELAGRTLGVVGCGRIGRGVASALRQAFGMKVLGFDTKPPSGQDGIAAAELDDLFSQADIVTLHLPSTPTTRGLIDENLLARMKPGAILVNAARGDLVDEDALVAGLSRNRPAAAAVDVFEPEPLPKDHPFWGLDNLFLTPHVAGLTDESSIRMSVQSVKEIIRILNGERPRSLINPEIWEAYLARLDERWSNG